MSIKVEIRSAQVNDIDTIYGFEREYIIEHEPDNLLKWESAKDNTIKYLIECLKRMFVAVVNDNLLGYGYWDIYEGSPCVYSIYIDQRHRGMGIAAKLMTSMEEQIKESGYNKITLSTLLTNNAQHLFSKLGYKLAKEEDGWLHYIKEL